MPVENGPSDSTLWQWIGAGAAALATSFVVLWRENLTTKPIAEAALKRAEENQEDIKQVRDDVSEMKGMMRILVEDRKA
jgi:hypothetical protein